MYADALEEAQAAAVGGLVDVLAALRGGAVDANELLVSQEAARLALDEPFIAATMLPGVALNTLVGGEQRDAAELKRESDAVTISDIVAVAQSVWDDALIQIPEGALDWAGFAAVPTRSTTEIVGRSFPSLDRGGVELVIGDDGVMTQGPEGRITVRFEDCVAMETWPDGARTLIGSDGFVVAMEPTLHGGLSLEWIEQVDAAVAAANHLPRPPRAPEQIPQPPPPAANSSGRTPHRWWRSKGHAASRSPEN